METPYDYEGKDYKDTGTATLPDPSSRTTMPRNDVVVPGVPTPRKYCKVQGCDGMLDFYGGDKPRWICGTCGSLDEEATRQAWAEDDERKKADREKFIQAQRQAALANAEHLAKEAAQKEAEANLHETIMHRLRKEAEDKMQQAVKAGYKPKKK